MKVGNVSETKHQAGHIGPRAQGQDGKMTGQNHQTGIKSLRERLLRRVLRVWFLVSRAHTLGVRGAAFDPQGRIFLVRHTYVSGWHLPGGGVEIGETFYNSLVRELSEEGHLHLTEPPQLFGLYHNKRSDKRDHVALFVCRNVHQESPHEGNGEIAESGFFDLDRLPPGVTPATQRRIAEIVNSEDPAPDW